MSVILPMIAILAVTSEWSQRSGLTTFTLVPSRGRVIDAKAIATVLVGLGSMAVAFAVGAVGNLASSAIVGVDTVWDVSLVHASQIVLGNLVGMAIGFTLGVVLRNSAGAIVGYFVVSLVMPGILVLLAQVRSWFADLQPWIDWNETQVALFEGATNTGEEWAMLASTAMIWIVIPLVVGLLSCAAPRSSSHTQAAVSGTHMSAGHRSFVVGRLSVRTGQRRPNASPVATSGSTTSAALTPPGSSPAAPASNP
jgi:large-conductance mechanosensitive channel